MDKTSRIVIIGAGIFGLSAAHQLASEGYRNIVVLDRHLPPVPDGSSTDISRAVRFDYGDGDYMDLSYEAYLRWRDTAKYKGIFYPCDYILAGTKQEGSGNWLDRTTSQLTKRGLPWSNLEDASATRKRFPILTGELASPGYVGYHNAQAGWADAAKAVTQIRDECIQLGVSFMSGQDGTVVQLETDTSRKGLITAAKTIGGGRVEGDHFILSAGAWTGNLVPMYQSTISTAQALGFVRLTPSEMEKYKDLPIYSNFCTGWFNFPPHEDTQMLKFAVHGWGYTRQPTTSEAKMIGSVASSTPPLRATSARANYTPPDAEQRLRDGLREMLPELADREFARTSLCWYTDTPSGDFIMDYHPDYQNLFIGGGGSGHAFKFLPVLSKYIGKAIHKELPPNLAAKWRFRIDYKDRPDTFLGDGSRGGPARRDLTPTERSKLDQINSAKL